MRGRLRIGVSGQLLTLEASGGHGRVWSRVLAELRRLATLVPLDPETGRPTRRLARTPDVILADGHAPLRPASVPLVVQVHEAGWWSPELRSFLDPQFYAEIAARTEAAVRAADHVIAPSGAARRDLVSSYKLDPERVHAVPHGVDPAFGPGARGGREHVARIRGGPAPYVLFAAMLHPRKNVAAVRGALAILAAEGFPQVLAIAGGPAVDRADSSALEAAASEELPGAPDRIVRVGRPPDAELAGLMAEADAFCLPSFYEGFGLTALEAMACGAAVVVSDRGALPEIVGDAGIVVEPSAESVAGALRALLGDQDRRRALGEAAVRRAREFTWRRTAAGWLDVLALAAGRRVAEGAAVHSRAERP
jgi:glycosyltransferase involved in cell wall biosynthesis